LKAKFEGDKLDATKAETNAQNAHALAGDALKNAMDAAQSSLASKTNTLADVEDELNEAKANLKDQRQLLDSDSATLEAPQKSCAMKATEWAERSDMRSKELEAMAAAIKILAKVGGVRTEPPSNPVPPPSPLEAGEPASFLQVIDPKMKAVLFLRAKARVMHSKALERLAQEVSAHLTGPFGEVNNMIQKMIFRLMAEQKDEDDHKNWCDLELEKTNSSKVNKEDKIEALTAKIDDAKATVEKLISEIGEAQEMIAAITAHVKEATEIRKVGKEENSVSLKDSQDAQTAIANAVSVLEAFYKESGKVPKEPWEFLQTGVDPVELPETPATWDSSYTGVADPNEQPSGIISVLKEISSDFARMEADTRAQEETDQKEFEGEMKDCAIEKAKRSKESEMKTQEKKRLGDKIDEMSKQRKHVSDELEAVIQYLKDLRPACVEGDSTYEDRKAARSTEIDALKEAQGILADAFKDDAGAPAAAPGAAFLAPVN
jgi:chromosome segregation ATPase